MGERAGKTDHGPPGEETGKGMEGEGKKGTFWARHGPTAGVILLVLYTVLLLIGTVAEIFDIEPILEWWIFRPPGRR